MVREERKIRTVEGDTADIICLREFGYTQAVTEQLLEANPGLADHGPTLPPGIEVVLPAQPQVGTSDTINMWD